MAQLGKISRRVLDSQGNPIPNASVEIRTQGAFVTSTQAGPTFTVDNIGGIAVGNQVKANATGTVTRNVSAVTITTVTTGGPGLGTLNNGDRITVTSALPTLYADENGDETKANPLTTDANGLAYCWAPVMPYDVLESATEYGSQLITDIVPEGVEDIRTNVFSGNPTAPFRRSTVRTLSAGNLETVENPLNVNKRSLDYAGNETLAGGLTAGGNLVVGGTSTQTGNASFGGTLSVTGASTLTGAVTVPTAFTYSGVAGGFSLTAGSIETADLATNATMQTTTAVGTADQTLTAAAYNTANYDTASGKGADITGASITITPFSTASEIVVIAECPVQAAGAAGCNAFMAIRDGTGTILQEGGAFTAAATGVPSTATLTFRETGVSGAKTYKVSQQVVSNNAVVNNSTNAATKRVTRITVIEFKR